MDQLHVYGDADRKTLAHGHFDVKDEPLHGDSKRFLELDGLRGLCACTVAACHFYLAFSSSEGQHSGFAPVAVYILFAMSGHRLAYRFLQDGNQETLLDSVVRRVPRLLLPVLWSVLLCWMLTTHGAFSFEKDWRRIRTDRMATDDHWCQGCFPSDVEVVLQSSWQMVSDFRVDHFVWLWTIPVQIFGSAMVFLLAPISHFLVNFGNQGDMHATDDLVYLCGQLWPTRLLRCLTAHGIFLAVVFVLGHMLNLCSRDPRAAGAAGWCMSPAVVSLQWLQVDSLWQTVLLFDLGLATAQMRVLLSGPSMCKPSWTDAFVSNWNANWQTKLLLPATLVLSGLATAMVTAPPARSVVDFGPTMSSNHAGFGKYAVAAAAIFLGVLISPKEVRGLLAHCSFLGNISFSIYLLHMGIIWAIGMPLYVLLHESLPHALLVLLVLVVCSVALLWLAPTFSLAIEDPLGVRLPRLACACLRWLILDSRTWLIVESKTWLSPAEEAKTGEQAEQAPTSMSDALEWAAMVLER